MAYTNRNKFGIGTIFHSNIGAQYTSDEVRKYLKMNSFHQSMGKGCYANSITETFFATLKKELIYRFKYFKRQEAMAAIFEYIECFYNKVRIHSALDCLSPAEYEAKLVV